MSEDENRLIEDESCDEIASSSRDGLQNWKRWSIITLFALFNVNMSYQVTFKIELYFHFYGMLRCLCFNQYTVLLPIFIT